MPAKAQEAYTNPVIAQKGVADPFILKWNGEYYLYVTGDPIRAFHSTDLVRWEEIGPVLSSSDAPDAWNQTAVWAPEVVYRNGRFYLYYTAARASDDWRVGEMTRRVGVGVSDSPRGPFEDVGHPVTPGWGIDGHVFRDPDGGDEYLFYSYLYEPRLPGAGIVAGRLASRDRVAGPLSHVTRGSEAWEDKDGDPHNGSVRYTNEAPTVLKRHGIYYMMYSGGSWDRPTYSLAYATSDEVMQDGLDGPGWAKSMPPILCSTSLVEGPGHNTVVKAPNNVDDITGYHARVVPFGGPGERQPFIDRLYWNHDRMHLQAPSLGALPAPDRPAFADRFNRSNGELGADWRVESGSWQIDADQAKQTQSASGLALPRAEPLAHYVFEANLRMPGAAPQGAAGVAAYYADEQNHLDVWLDRGKKALVTTGILGGEALDEETTSLPEDFRFDAYHQLLVTKNADRLRVTLDGVNRQERALEDLSAGTVGLRTRGAQADFDGVALTPHYGDHFDESDASWTRQSGAWIVDEGALHQSAGGSARYMALKGDPAADYEFTASLRWRGQESTEAKAGIVAAATPEGEAVVAGFNKTIWPFARLWVQHLAEGDVRQSFSVGLPRGFDYDVYHTLRVVKRGGAFTFYLDGEETAAARFPLGTARPGLFTEGVRAAFDDAAMKHLGVLPNRILDGSFEAEAWAETTGAPEPPWQLSGEARPHRCCAHSGSHRLLLTADGDAARQTISGLAPGAYTLYAWATTRGAEAEVRVEPAGGSVQRASAAGGDWQQIQIDFDVAEGPGSATISVSGRFEDRADAFVAADDFYLFKR